MSWMSRWSVCRLDEFVAAEMTAPAVEKAEGVAGNGLAEMGWLQTGCG